MREQFIDREFSATSRDLILMVGVILTEYADQGYRLSLRQLYYQLVSRDLVENTVRSYKRIGDLVSNARLAGLIDWDMIEDRGRESVVNTHWKNAAEIARAAAQSFRIDMWADQPCYVEVMVEKDALSGILEPVCKSCDVRFTANKGYSSSSAMYEAGKRITRAINDGKDAHLFYLGDHDPSGIDMTRDIISRLELFTYGQSIETVRLALNMDQVREWNPPKNPAKETDSRFAAYLHRFGDSSWELDAVEPKTLASLVEDAVTALIDDDLWKAANDRQEAMRKKLTEFADKTESEK